MKRSFLTGTLTVSAIATAAVISAQPAQALQIVTYNFFGSNQHSSQLNFSPVGFPSAFSVTATASRLNLQTNVSSDVNVAIRPQGIGVQGGPSGPEISKGIVGGHTLIETLRLNFNGQVVRLISATFGDGQNNDDFRLLKGDGTLIVEAKTKAQQNSATPTFNFAQANVNESARTGTIFDFTVPALGTDDDYFLRSLTVEVIPTPAAVLPGLVGMGAAAFRKKQQQNAEA
ncbi:MAG: PTPA-CTERM sorting domain-containing protein [Leptolyngbyaceae cyanobacterium SM2_5_2]|nr:PTPA-CTERM sorting domain-containing protein [Leptolyngbyaceae cyanobacterium SM2_5_2]